MLLDAARSTLLVIDVQSSLLPPLEQPEAMVAQCARLIEIATRLDVPIQFTEQYPAGLGPTDPRLRRLAPDAPAHGKTVFSVLAAQVLPATPTPGQQVVLCGMEAHVCVLHSALDLLAAGYQVAVVQDAVSARGALELRAALARMQAAGAQLITVEMALFEWTRDAAHPAFKGLSRDYRQRPRPLPLTPFAEVLRQLPSVHHLAGIRVQGPNREAARIDNQPGQAGSVAVYHALQREFGQLTPEAARAGLRLYAEHTEDARLHPGKHPNIDRLFQLSASGETLDLELLPA